MSLAARQVRMQAQAHHADVPSEGLQPAMPRESRTRRTIDLSAWPDKVILACRHKSVTERSLLIPCAGGRPAVHLGRHLRGRGRHCSIPVAQDASQGHPPGLPGTWRQGGPALALQVSQAKAMLVHQIDGLKQSCPSFSQECRTARQAAARLLEACILLGEQVRIVAVAGGSQPESDNYADELTAAHGRWGPLDLG